MTIAIDLKFTFRCQAVCGCTKPQEKSSVMFASCVVACKASTPCVMPCAAAGQSERSSCIAVVRGGSFWAACDQPTLLGCKWA